MLDPLNYVTNEEEKQRYETHNNDIEDIRYQEFVWPIVDSVKRHYRTSHAGLDYGAGTGPVIASLLGKAGYDVKLYDPYFHRHPENLYGKYDYIICCEVIEHFHKPYDEFQRLTDMLNAGGSIFCMTSLYGDDIDFEKWGYKNDETHVFFYHKKALAWMKREFNFSGLETDDKFIKLTK